MLRVTNGLAWQILLWAAVVFALVGLSDNAPFVLFEHGQPGHALLVGAFLLTSILVFFHAPRARGLVRVHLGVVAVIFMAIHSPRSSNATAFWRCSASTCLPSSIAVPRSLLRQRWLGLRRS